MKHLPIQLAGDETHVHPRHTGHRGLDMVLALSAIFISAISLYVAVEHGHTEQRLVAANSWPFLQISREGGAHIRYSMANAGIGPAKLEHFETFYRGEPVDSLRTLLVSCCGLPRDRATQQRLYPHLSENSLNATVFRPGQSYDVMLIDRDHESAELLDRFDHALSSISFQGCYCSVFDECWTGNLIDLHTVPVARCPTGPSFNDLPGE